MMQRPGPVVMNLLIINGLVFLATMMYPQWMDLFAIHYWDSPRFYPFQIVSAMFTHGSIIHLALNMMGLYFLGQYMEYVWGPKRFLRFYLIAGLGAGLFTMLLQTIVVLAFNGGSPVAPEVAEVIAGTNTTPWRQIVDATHPRVWDIYRFSGVGASGALFGVLMAFGLRFPHVQLQLLFPPIPVKAQTMVYVLSGVSVIGIVVPGFLSGIGHMTHLGGLVVGYIYLAYFDR